MFKKVKYFLDYFKYLDNPLEALKFKFGFSDSVNLKIKGVSIKISDVKVLNNIMATISNVSDNLIEDFANYENEYYNEEFIHVEGVKLINCNYVDFKKNNSHEYVTHLYEYFMDFPVYSDFIDVNGKHVIDIGANVADSALIFANQGAEVIAFEPVKHLYDLALENISLNPKLSDKITLINKGVGGKSGILSADSDLVEEYIDDSSQDMEIISFKDMLDDYDFTPDILKIDCEGCEYEIILNHDLSMFNEIIFEHHAIFVRKDYRILIDRLKEQGFKIKTAANNSNFEEIGLIYAYK